MSKPEGDYDDIARYAIRIAGIAAKVAIVHFRNTKLHSVTNTTVRPIRFFITVGQVSDYSGTMALLNGLPDAEWLLADRGYDVDWFRETLPDRGEGPCIPGRKFRNKVVRYNKCRFRRRNRIERMFGRLKDW